MHTHANIMIDKEIDKLIINHELTLHPSFEARE